ncbi:hypothetical protein CgunFtcFv8_013906 [Champsocephalus gunnari]|uniref:Uncharacterized protein n=2 Tax=Champsocephalus gunnari TaxID=52237 RepID=A0AAN8E1P8_CHAGU|nr:hypothetical protein CgunFtcFv8_013906 [Champsocephalus gunnari]
MQTAEMKNAEVEEEERLTAEKGEKADQMEVENEKRKEKVIKKITLKERKDESERMEDLKTGEKPQIQLVAGGMKGSEKEGGEAEEVG